MAIPVIDVFAGPGGLNEGFSRVLRRQSAAFDIVASFEMEIRAVDTLRLRSAIRRLSSFSATDLYQPYLDFLNTETNDVGVFISRREVAAAIEATKEHIHQFTLSESNREESDEIIRKALPDDTPWVLIGGPPCQAYSLAGRSRRAHDPTFDNDHKHFLYREYLHIIDEFRPSVFVMENVKGLLSSTNGGQGMFARIIEDLSLEGRYQIRSLVVDGENLRPSDFVIRAEEYGIPQRRHRVILLGLDSEIASRRTPGLLPRRGSPVTVWDAIGGMRPVTSRVSRAGSPARGQELWNRALADGHALASKTISNAGPLVMDMVTGGVQDEVLNTWLRVKGLTGYPQHAGRRHMATDLTRYAYLAKLAEHGIAPRVHQLPDELKPDHKNMNDKVIPFVDRFKVQVWHRPSGTVASHICKDGHYYIHPDPQQMRSLTVREAARLQTFPDDYYFMGTQTSQYQQVGNAVPPYLAMQIAEVVADVLE